MTTKDPSRRSALVGGATALAGLAAALAVSTHGSEALAQNATITAADVPHLNALLTEEYKLVKAYRDAIDVLTTPPTGDPGTANAGVFLAVATYIRGQHRTQAAQLAAAIMGAAGTPVNEATINFTPPTSYTGTVANVVKLATNLERSTSVAYTNRTRNLGAAASALAAAIAGAHTQNFVILYLLAKDIARGTAMTAMMPQDLCPQAFVSSVGGGTTGLEAVADFTFGPVNP